MVHQHYEPGGNVADGPNGPAASRLPAEDSYQDCQSETTVYFVISYFQYYIKKNVILRLFRLRIKYIYFCLGFFPNHSKDNE